MPDSPPEKSEVSEDQAEISPMTDILAQINERLQQEIS